MPVLHQAIAAHSSAVTDGLGHTSDDVARLERIIHLLIEGGAPVNGYRASNTPLLAAILYCDSVAVGILLESESDPKLPVKREGHSSDGMDAFEFSNWLDERARRDSISEPDGCRRDIAGMLLTATSGSGE